MSTMTEETLYECPQCHRPAPWTDGTDTEYWCQICGAETPLSACTVQINGQRYPWHPDHPPAVFDVRLAHVDEDNGPTSRDSMTVRFD